MTSGLTAAPRASCGRETIVSSTCAVGWEDLSNLAAQLRPARMRRLELANAALEIRLTAIAYNLKRTAVILIRPEAA
jgi:hypothetical protein